MKKETNVCEICGKKVDEGELRTCRGCGKKYCHRCRSNSTNQDYCKECVGMKGVVPH